MGFLDNLLGRDDPEDDARELRIQQDLERLAQGGVPLAAEQRLEQLAAGTSGFTSNLSVSDYALASLERVQPICQVMGSSVYKVGWQNYPWGGFFSSSDPQLTELSQLTNAWNEARSLALQRLQREAAIAGAHAVVDVTFTGRRHDFLQDDIEIIVVGTAVRLPEGREGPPVLSDLSLPDFTLLRKAGYAPVGVVTASSIWYVIPSRQTVNATSGWQRFQPNQELPEYTQGVYTARETALSRCTDQALEQGAQGMVGMVVEQDIDVREVEQNKRKRYDLIVTMHVLGTGIQAHGEHRPLNPDLIVRQNPERSRDDPAAV
jgi:uncharacterized protein YbjQ (UPF0145 family)